MLISLQKPIETIRILTATVVHTAVEQKLTYDVKRDILEWLMELDGITPDEAELLKDLDENKK